MDTIGIKVIRFKNEEVENNFGNVFIENNERTLLNKFPLSNIREGARG